ncbi:DUF2335 domain-containing protein [Enterococcus faecium]|nr:DUF2335 domain-containing protein [Enterococcus faecium]
MKEQNYNTTKEISSNEEIIEILDKVDKMEPEDQAQTIMTLEMHYGPIPHPDILKKYKELDKGSAKLIIENGVQESVHRREMEKLALEKSVRDKRRGQYLGFLIGLIVIMTGFWLINNNHPITGTLLSGTSLLGLVGSFTGNDSSYNYNKKEDDNEESEE